MNLIVKVFGLGMLVTVMDMLLAQAGRKDIAYVLIIAGVVVGLLIIIPEISKVLNTTMNTFGF